MNVDENTGYTDLQMYYFKLMNAYGQNTGFRNITAFPTATDFEPNTPEFKIVGDLVANDNQIISLSASGSLIQVGTKENHGLSRDDSVRIAGIANTTFMKEVIRLQELRAIEHLVIIYHQHLMMQILFLHHQQKL